MRTIRDGEGTLAERIFDLSIPGEVNPMTQGEAMIK